MIAHAHDTLRRETNRVGDAGLVLAIEDHQDVGSEELVDLVEQLGPHAGICLDTGNPFSVGEDPVAFTRRAAHRIRHVHLKDYVAQFTDEGYRLVRCAVGDGAVPFEEIAAVLEEQGTPLAASIEPGALESRHIRLFTPDWWNGYPARDARELGTMLGRLRARRLADDDGLPDAVGEGRVGRRARGLRACAGPAQCGERPGTGDLPGIGRFKSQIPSSKSQRTPNQSRFSLPAGRLEIGSWECLGIWSFGAWELHRAYSCLSARIGSARIAFIAGSRQAASATAVCSSAVTT